MFPLVQKPDHRRTSGYTFAVVYKSKYRHTCQVLLIGRNPPYSYASFPLTSYLPLFFLHILKNKLILNFMCIKVSCCTSLLTVISWS